MLNKKSRHSQEGPWYGIFFPLNISHTRKQKDEINIRRVTTVSGGILSNAVLVAINEAAQKKQAAAKANLADIGTFCCWAFLSII